MSEKPNNSTKEEKKESLKEGIKSDAKKLKKALLLSLGGLFLVVVAMVAYNVWTDYNQANKQVQKTDKK